MGYVVNDIIERLWSEYGRPAGHEWEQFLAWCGIPVQYRDFSRWGVAGAVHENTIFLDRHLSKDEMARTAFHECAHFLCHDGDVRWWRSRPQGDITIAKFERQAEEFMELFPDWDG